nr:hypothetical protein Iba_scaffold11342.2CG0090 [Ipomoea batatas]
MASKNDPKGLCANFRSGTAGRLSSSALLHNASAVNLPDAPSTELSAKPVIEKRQATCYSHDPYAAPCRAANVYFELRVGSSVACRSSLMPSRAGAAYFLILHLHLYRSCCAFFSCLPERF